MVDVNKRTFGDKYEWSDKANVMPFFKIPSDWSIAVTPPFTGADARFRIKTPSGNRYSVYADFDETLGYFDGRPYWEVYPIDGDVARFSIEDIDLLIDLIREQEKK